MSDQNLNAIQKDELVSPFESNPRYVEILQEIRELRKDGETTITELRSENRDLKLNKQIDPEIKAQQIKENNERIKVAQTVKAANAAKIKELIAEARQISSVDTAEHVKAVNEVQNANINEAKTIYAQELAEANQLHTENVAKITEIYNNNVQVATDGYNAKVEEVNSKVTDPEELKKQLADVKADYNKHLKHIKEEYKGQMSGEKVRAKSKVLELQTNKKDAIEKAKTAKFDAYHDKYSYMGKVRGGSHTPIERMENIWKTFIFSFNIKDFLIKNGLYFIILIFLLYCVIQSFVNGGNLLSKDNILAVLSQSSTKLFFSLGVAGLILLGGTDLSIGRMTGMAASFTCLFLGRAAYESDLGFGINAMSWPTPVRIIVALVVSIALCVAFSSIAGFFTAKFKMHPFITTLSTQLLIFGIMMVMWKSTPAFNMNLDIKKGITGASSINIIIFAVIAILVMWFIWNKTKFGKNMYAVGGNQEAASVSGISVFKTTLLVFVMAGVLYGIGGFLEGARVGTANPSTGSGTELDAIAACVIGGISFSGGVGKIKGAVIGTLIFTCMTYFLTNLGFDTNMQFIFKGIIIMAAVCLDSLKYLKKK